MKGQAMLRLTLVVVAALALTSCEYTQMNLAPPLRSWSSYAGAMPVTYRIVAASPGTVVGSALWSDGRCTVTIVDDPDVDLMTHIAAHEIGHCMDGAHLLWTSNGFTDEGCIWGAHFCAAHEGYAEAYAQTYLRVCGSSRSPLGFRPPDYVRCALPDPRSVTPEGLL